jgi:hypothetical protein
MQVQGEVLLEDSIADMTCSVKVRHGAHPGSLTGSVSPIVSSRTVSYVSADTHLISDIQPSFGSAAGGDTLTITGTGLTPSLELWIGGALCLNVIELTAGTSYSCVTAKKVYGSNSPIMAI